MAAVDEPAPMICRAAAAVAMFVPGALVLFVIGTAYATAFNLGGLYGMFLLGSLPPALVIPLDVKIWRQTGGRRARSPLPVGGDAMCCAALGLLLILVGAFFSYAEFGFRSVGEGAFPAWTSTTIGYLLMAALGGQAVLLVLTLLMKLMRILPASRLAGFPKNTR